MIGLIVVYGIGVVVVTWLGITIWVNGWYYGRRSMLLPEERRFEDEQDRIEGQIW